MSIGEKKYYIVGCARGVWIGELYGMHIQNSLAINPFTLVCSGLQPVIPLLENVTSCLITASVTFITADKVFLIFIPPISSDSMLYFFRLSSFTKHLVSSQP